MAGHHEHHLRMKYTKQQEEEGAVKQQVLLPCFQRGATEINNMVAVFRNDNTWTYFLGGYPIHAHKGS